MGANLNNAVLFLVSTLFDLYLWVMILRVLLQIVRADFYNPISQFIWQVTRLPVQPLARVVPKWQRVDLAAMLVGFVLACIYMSVLMGLLNQHPSLPVILWLALWTLVTLTLKLYAFTIFVQAMLSWLGPGTQNPAGSVLWSLNEPLLRPIRRFLPPIGGLDLSPLFAILALLVLIRLVPLVSVLR